MLQACLSQRMFVCVAADPIDLSMLSYGSAKALHGREEMRVNSRLVKRCPPQPVCRSCVGIVSIIYTSGDGDETWMPLRSLWYCSLAILAIKEFTKCCQCHSSPFPTTQHDRRLILDLQTRLIQRTRQSSLFTQHVKYKNFIHSSVLTFSQARTR